MFWNSLASRCQRPYPRWKRDWMRWDSRSYRYSRYRPFRLSFSWSSRRVPGKSFLYRPRPHACLARNTVWRGGSWRTTFHFPKVRARTCCSWLSRLSSSAGRRCQCAAACHWCGLPSWYRTVRENPYSWFPRWKGRLLVRWRCGNSPLMGNHPRCRVLPPRRVSDSPPCYGVVHLRWGIRGMLSPRIVLVLVLLYVQNEPCWWLMQVGENSVLQQLNKVNVSLSDIHNLFLTHAHTDHVLGAVWVGRLVMQLMRQDKYNGVLHVWGMIRYLVCCAGFVCTHFLAKRRNATFSVLNPL